ncbi:MAG TPA: L-asparaginase [Nitrospiraceae bacterium]|jgi:L-asparaginase/beta-aspartyl-peptidase (threonine type)|nr:L-asparaginase [Nitrospiraceae bacterium]
MITYGVVTHGGAGSPVEFLDGCTEACEAALSLLKVGRSALDAVVEAVRILEDDGRFNAGSGSALRLDGTTIEMDAAVMDSRGYIGIVISIRDVKNPVLVARAIIETPHIALSSQGATAFARKRGFPPFRQISQYAQERHKRIERLIREGRLGEENPRWQNRNVETFWNFDAPSDKDICSCDTVGAVALDKEGILAVATSTGGASPMMMGRVGDSPMIGCGFYAGPSAAVATTGVGEEIIKKMVAKTVYDMVSQGEEIRTASEKGISMVPSNVMVGLIALSREGFAAVSNRQMAYSVRIRED